VIVPVQRVSFIFGDGQRNLATASANAELLNPGNTELGETSATRKFLIFGFVPVQRASFIFGSGGRCKCGNVKPR